MAIAKYEIIRPSDWVMAIYRKGLERGKQSLMGEEMLADEKKNLFCAEKSHGLLNSGESAVGQNRLRKKVHAG